IVVYTSFPAVQVVRWYTAIRAARLNLMRVAYPGVSDMEKEAIFGGTALRRNDYRLPDNALNDFLTSPSQFLPRLTVDFPAEGWLWKSGPRTSDAWRRRWFTLDGRKLMYHELPLSAHPRGEIFVGHQLEGWSVWVPDMSNGLTEGTNGSAFPCPPAAVVSGKKNQPSSTFAFVFRTPERCFTLVADTVEDRDKWVRALEALIATHPTPQELRLSAQLVTKRNSGILARVL
ncbi:unnamed protein product, partial [Cyprideis torosa]